MVCSTKQQCKIDCHVFQDETAAKQTEVSDLVSTVQCRSDSKHGSRSQLAHLYMSQADTLLGAGRQQLYEALDAIEEASGSLS